jgi:CDP-paratose 2-epimerase
MGKEILVTGGAGFVGSNLAVSFAREGGGYNVVALDNLKRRGSELNLRRLKESGVRFVHGDIRNPEDLELSGFEPDVIIECSAEPSVLAGYNTSPRYALNTNLVGTLNCLELARSSGADVIFLSTSRVYPIERGITHEFPLDGNRSLYGATKLSSELVLEEYSAMYGIRGVVNRCGVLAGPWQMGKTDQGVFALWVGSHYFKKKLAYFGYGGMGKQVRDLLHIDDLYRLVSWQVENMDRVVRMVFNVGGGRPVSLSLLETTEACRELTGNQLDIKGVEKEREADVRVYLSDINRVKEVTGWSPEKGSIDILADIFGWINSNEDDVKRVLFG